MFSISISIKKAFDYYLVFKMTSSQFDLCGGTMTSPLV
jgi:hypothetical protein